jgi:hypothetical protein
MIKSYVKNCKHQIYASRLVVELNFRGAHHGTAQWRSQDFEVGGTMASAKREPIWGSGGRAHSGVQELSLYFSLEFTPL